LCEKNNNEIQAMMKEKGRFIFGRGTLVQCQFTNECLSKLIVDFMNFEITMVIYKLSFFLFFFSFQVSVNIESNQA
jgi:hypothetical protein